MSLLIQVQNDITSSVTLSTVMRKAQVLAYSLKIEELKAWVTHELGGYDGKPEDLPAYRKIPTQTYGTFRNLAYQMDNVQVPGWMLPHQLWAWADTFPLFYGIRELESMLETMDAKHTDHVKGRWNAQVVENISKMVRSEEMVCLEAWRVLARGSVAQVLDDVRTKLLHFVLELQDRFPELAHARTGQTPPIPQEELRRVFLTVIMGGNQNVIGTAGLVTQEGNMAVFDQRNQKVNYQYNAAGDINIEAIQNRSDLVGELKKLKAELARAGEVKVIDAEIVMDAEYQVTKAIQQAQKTAPDKRAILEHLGQAKTFVEGVSAAAGLVTALTKAAELVQKFF